MSYLKYHYFIKKLAIFTFNSILLHKHVSLYNNVIRNMSNLKNKLYL